MQVGEGEKLRGGEVGEDREENLRGKLEEGGGARWGRAGCWIRGAWLGGLVTVIIWRERIKFLNKSSVAQNARNLFIQVHVHTTELNSV